MVMRFLRFFLPSVLTLMISCLLNAETRTSFDAGWLFRLGDDPAMSDAGYDDSSWRSLNLPHDWAVEGDFSVWARSGAGGGSLPGGIGWYRKHFTASPQANLFIDFDGVYMNSTVWVNGHLLGNRPFGYISFRYDLTPYIVPGGDNVIAVRVDNSDQPNSRWYSGCGIYRHTWLVESSPVHVAHWGTYVTSELSEDFSSCVFTVQTEVEGMENGSSVVLRHSIKDAEGNVVGKSQKKISSSSDVQKITVKNPQLWSVERPCMYTVLTELISRGETVDAYETPTGVRKIEFDAAKGFFLNGRSLKINGVCLHHDHGCLGAAFSEDALHRQFSRLREMGVNAIRCSHNPPAPEMLAMCDSMGLMVMDECFDMWRRRKTQNDYARFFDQWHERDFSDMLRRDRNHPSIIMWSIGNEVLEQWKDADADTLTLEQVNLILNAGHDVTAQGDGENELGILIARHLSDMVRRFDTTRPVTAGCNEPSPGNYLFRSGALDIIGYNYHLGDIPSVPENFPGKPFVLSESVSSLQSRGVYMMPSDSVILAPSRWDRPYSAPEYTRSAYDNSRAPWGSTHEESLDAVKFNDFVAGQFVWTGWDYIGEPTPFDYPAHSSYFGIVDLAGFPKDAYWLYQSEWTSDTVLHLFPHWNWIPGQDVDMWCYYNNADEVELFINGESQGVRSKQEHVYHTCWSVKFVPGTVTVVSRCEGREVARRSVSTAGQPHHLRLTADYRGRDLTFINVEVVDAEGNDCPWASDKIWFSVENGTIEGVDNGDAASLERYKADCRRAFNGKAMVVVRPDGKGPFKLTAKAVGLPTAEWSF